MTSLIHADVAKFLSSAHRSALAQNLAEVARLEGVAGRHVALTVSPEHRAYRHGVCQEALEQALTDHFGMRVYLIVAECGPSKGLRK